MDGPPIAWDVYAAVAEALGRIGGDDARTALVRLTKHGYPLSRAADPAIEQIDRISGGVSTRATAPAPEIAPSGPTAPNAGARVETAETLVEPLLVALKQRKSGASDELAALSARLHDPRPVRRIARLLWWRLSDDDGSHVLDALARVASRLTVLEVQAIEQRD